MNIAPKGFWKIYLKSGSVLDNRRANSMEQCGDCFTVSNHSKGKEETTIDLGFFKRKTVAVIKEMLYVVPIESVVFCEWVDTRE